MQVIITFSLSVLISFLSSLFFNFPGASAMGREVWKMKSLPAHSAACRKENAIAQVRNIYKNYKQNYDSRTSIQAFSSLYVRKALSDTQAQWSLRYLSGTQRREHSLPVSYRKAGPLLVPWQREKDWLHRNTEQYTGLSYRRFCTMC